MYIRIYMIILFYMHNNYFNRGIFIFKNKILILIVEKKNIDQNKSNGFKYLAS